MLKLILAACAVATIVATAQAQDRTIREDGLQNQMPFNDLWRNRSGERRTGEYNSTPRCTWRKRLDDFGHMHSVRVCSQDRRMLLPMGRPSP